MAKGKKDKKKQQGTNAANQIAEPNAQSKPSDTVSQASTRVGTEAMLDQEKREVRQEEFPQVSTPKVQQEAKIQEGIEQHSKIASVEKVEGPNVEVISAQVRPNQNQDLTIQSHDIKRPLIQEPIQIIESVVPAQPQKLPQKVQETSIKNENVINQEEIVVNNRLSEPNNQLEQRDPQLIQISEDTKIVNIDKPLNQAVEQTQEIAIIKKEENPCQKREQLIQQNQPISQKKEQKIDQTSFQKIENPPQQNISPVVSHIVEAQKLDIHEPSEPVVLGESQTIEEIKKEITIAEQERTEGIALLKEQTVLIPLIDNSKQQEKKPQDRNSDDVILDLSKPIDLDQNQAPKIQEPIFTMVQSHQIQSESQKSEYKSQVIREVEKEIKIEVSQSFSDLNYSVERDQVDPTRSQPVNIHSHEVHSHEVQEVHSHEVHEVHSYEVHEVHEVKQPQIQIIQQTEVHAKEEQRVIKPQILSETINVVAETVKTQSLSNQNHLEQVRSDKVELVQPTKEEIKIQDRQSINQQEKKPQRLQDHVQIVDVTQKIQAIKEIKIEEKKEVPITEKIELLIQQDENHRKPVKEELIIPQKNESVQERSDVKQQLKKEEITVELIKEQVKQKPKQEVLIEQIIQQPVKQANQPIKVESRSQSLNNEAIIQHPTKEQIKKQINIEVIGKLQQQVQQLQLVQDKVQSKAKQSQISEVKEEPLADSSKIDDPRESMKPDKKKKTQEFGKLKKLALSVGIGAVLGGSVWAFQNNSLRSVVAGVGATALTYLIS